MIRDPRGLMRTKRLTAFILLQAAAGLTLAGLYFGRPEPATPGRLFAGDSIYNHVTVTEHGTKRSLIFGRVAGLRQTCVDLAKPDEPCVEYTALMLIGLALQPEPRKMALIGLGGGFLPLFLGRNRPEIDLTVVEVDPLVARLSESYFGYRPQGSHRLVIADGRMFLRRAAEKYDQIWLDAFDSDYIPAHLTTREFLTLVKERLAPGGLVVQNVFRSAKLYPAQVKTMAAVFKDVFVFEAKTAANAVLVGTDRPRVEPADFGRWAWSINVDLGPVSLREQALKFQPRPPATELPVLTDDYNPANLWLHRD